MTQVRKARMSCKVCRKSVFVTIVGPLKPTDTITCASCHDKRMNRKTKRRW